LVLTGVELAREFTRKFTLLKPIESIASMNVFRTQGP
jgi:hypothetical protein